jgi:hypothetical protein
MGWILYFCHKDVVFLGAIDYESLPLSVTVHLMLQRSLFVIEPSVGVFARSVHAQPEMPVQVRSRIHEEHTPIASTQDKNRKED